METIGKQVDTLLVAHEGACAYVHVQGRGTFKISPALKSFGNDALEKGARMITFDMTLCETMDSTFMGVMAGLAMRVRRQPAGGKVMVLNLGAKTIALLRQLGLDRLLECHEAGNPLPSGGAAAQRVELRSAPGGSGQQDISVETMLTAHEDLVRACPENLPKFMDVITYLKEAKEKGAAR